MAYTPNLADFTMLTARLIGFQAKFGIVWGVFAPTELGLITDTTSCEEGVFSVNPFTDMTVDVFTGVTVSQTHNLELNTAWGRCAYTYLISPV